MRILSAAFTLAVLVAAVSSTAYAAEGRGPRGKPGEGMMDPSRYLLRDIQLTDEQKTKIEDIRKEYAPKVADAVKKMGGILTDEQKKAREEAMKTARDAGKRGKEFMEAVQGAVKLTDEQKKKMDDARKEMETVGKELREKIMGVLTDEQKKKIEKAMKDRGPRGKRSDKPEKKPDA